MWKKWEAKRGRGNACLIFGRFAIWCRSLGGIFFGRFASAGQSGFLVGACLQPRRLFFGL